MGWGVVWNSTADTLSIQAPPGAINWAIGSSGQRVGKPMPIRPLLVSKANTVAQIVLATLVLAEQAFGFDAGLGSKLIMALVAILTLLSIAFYLAEWVRHMNSFGAGH